MVHYSALPTIENRTKVGSGNSEPGHKLPSCHKHCKTQYIPQTFHIQSKINRTHNVATLLVAGDLPGDQTPTAYLSAVYEHHAHLWVINIPGA